MAGRIVDRIEQAARLSILCAAFEADRALRRGRQPVFGIEARAHAAFAQPIEAGCGQEGRIGLSARQLRHARRDVPAEGDDLAVRPVVKQLRRTAGCARADDRSRFELCDRRRAEQPVRDIGARQDRSDDEAVGPDRLDILHRMDRRVDPPFVEPDVEFARPQRLAADLCERAVLYLVAAGDDGHEFDRFLRPAMRLAQSAGSLFRLRHRKRRAARAEPQFRAGCGQVGHGGCLP